MQVQQPLLAPGGIYWHLPDRREQPLPHLAEKFIVLEESKAPVVFEVALRIRLAWGWVSFPSHHSQSVKEGQHHVDRQVAGAPRTDEAPATGGALIGGQRRRKQAGNPTFRRLAAIPITGPGSS